MFEDYVTEAVHKMFSWDISDEELSHVISEQAALLARLDHH